MNTEAVEHNREARRIAFEAMTRLRSEPTGLVRFGSSGRLLVIADQTAAGALPPIPSELQTQLLLLDGTDPVDSGAVRQQGRPLRIEGYLGKYRVELGAPGDDDRELLKADLILDLSLSPLLARDLAPAGYLHSAPDPQTAARAVTELSGLVGTFEKPIYVDYDASICAHGRSGHIACSRCIDACPAHAITGLAEAIEVDPYLCQGGGICATVCPSGAIKYTYPYAKDSLERIRVLLQTYRENGGSDPVLALFSAGDADPADFTQDNLLPVGLEELASAGLEVWLSALAYGARRLLLVDGGNAPAPTTAALALQIEIGQTLLEAMRLPTDAITLIGKTGWETVATPVMPELPPAGFYGLREKRESLFMAIDHLFAQSDRPIPIAPLPAGAPFGSAQVDEKRCTLCMACVGACPGRALQSGQDTPRLTFVESNCLQCGMCTRTCPEDAIWITPRLVFDRETRIRPRLLYEEPPFLCSVCGKPFATRSAIERTLTKLSGHWMFQNERARNRLTMCDSCRVADAVQDAELMDPDAQGQVHQ